MPVYAHRDLLRINVGFLLKESAGYTREVAFEYADLIQVDEVVVHSMEGALRLSRTPQGVVLVGTLRARIPSECVRCLSPFDLPFTIEFSNLFVPIATLSLEARHENPYVIDDGDNIDLAPLVREDAILAVPIQPLCSPGCKGLCPECGQDLNKGTCECSAGSVDPRMAALRTLLNDQQG
ncbi:MAG: DUF177 domain-containing protein [Anaerolineae bacterium]|nr:DUF177 domain-containing protein [Anaerolineae bacterium]